MKKYNNSTLEWVCIGIIIPVLTFLVCVICVHVFMINKVHTPPLYATINIAFANNQITEYTSTTHSSELLPGDTIQIYNSIVNKSSSDIYTIIRFNVSIRKASETAFDNVSEEYYTIVDNKLVRLIYSESNNRYEGNPILLKGNNEISFKLEYNHSKYFGNEYLGAIVMFETTAISIASESININDATNMIISQSL